MIQPSPEQVHWLFATGFLFLALCLLTEAIVGADVWRRRAWRAYLWPGALFLTGLMLWPVMVFFTKSTIHMLAHGAWAQLTMIAGAIELALVRGKLRSDGWRLATGVAIVASGAFFLVHEQNPWLFSRSAFLHHAIGWTLLVGGVFPLAQAFRPRSAGLQAGFAVTALVVTVLVYCHRDVAPIFGHLSEFARPAGS